jgi:hypothetical protein
MYDKGYRIFRASNDYALAAPEDHVKEALSTHYPSREELEAKVNQLLQDYPNLSVVPTKRTRRAAKPRLAKRQKSSALATA